ncbi:MAG: hypothetical protein ACLRZZ_22915 [Enterocloster sp.]
MIQEIKPHRFRNEFHVKTPSPNSYFLYFQDGSILLEHTDALKIPRFSELSDSDAVKDHCDYLFSIDSAEYYLIDETSVTISENETLALYKTSVIRDLEPLWMAFAAANGAELHRFYSNNRFCGRCGTKSMKEQKRAGDGLSCLRQHHLSEDRAGRHRSHHRRRQASPHQIRRQRIHPLRPGSRLYRIR